MPRQELHFKLDDKDLSVTGCTCMHIENVQNVPEFILDSIWQFAALQLR